MLHTSSSKFQENLKLVLDEDALKANLSDIKLSTKEELTLGIPRKQVVDGTEVRDIFQSANVLLR